jgi:hypothetical protein
MTVHIASRNEIRRPTQSPVRKVNRIIKPILKPTKLNLYIRKNHMVINIWSDLDNMALQQ